MILDDLGPRVCIMGPSNSGKSTLATALGMSRALPIVHLDQLRHLPGTQWEVRPDDEFHALHERAIATERWVIDGNYSQLLDARLDRATGLILLDASAPASLVRYLRRTWGNGARLGGLDGVTDRANWEMISFIAGPAQASRRRYRELFEGLELPKVFLRNRHALERFYERQGLQRP